MLWNVRVRRCASLILVGIAAAYVAGCSTGPSGFETYELNYRDSVQVELTSSQAVIVLEQLPDGPVDEYKYVSHDVRSFENFGGSILLEFDVIGLSTTASPATFIETRRDGDTLFVWHADEPRENVYPVARKLSGASSVLTTPKETYVKITHVEIAVPVGTDVQFSNRFVW